MPRREEDLFSVGKGGKREFWEKAFPAFKIGIGEKGKGTDTKPALRSPFQGNGRKKKGPRWKVSCIHEEKKKKGSEKKRGAGRDFSCPSFSRGEEKGREGSKKRPPIQW